MGMTYSKRKKRNSKLAKLVNRSSNSKGNYKKIGKNSFGKMAGKKNMRYKG